MSAIVFLIEQTAIGLYILIAIGLVINWRRLMRARQDYRATQYELEREIFRYKRSNAVTFMILLIQAALIVFGIQQVVAPALRVELNDSSETNQQAEVLTDGLVSSPTPPQVDFGQNPIDVSGVQIGEAEIIQV